MTTIWKKRNPAIEYDAQTVRELAEECGLSPFMTKCLMSRGLKDPEAIMTFLEPDWDDLHNPFLLPDIEQALDRLIRAKQHGETVCVYGDYDVDGMTATSILIRYFNQVGINAFYRLPNRHTEGYGMHIDALDEVIAKGADLIVTVDNGISAFEECRYLKEKGIDLIITDHHEWQGERPDALAVIDPKVPDSCYPFKNLCGAGIAFKLVQALNAALGNDSDDLSEVLECAAMATIADLVPLQDENRVITSLGLASMNFNHMSKGIAALAAISNCSEITAYHVGFVLAPKMNAAGRLGDAGIVVEMLTSDDDKRIKAIASELAAKNEERQQIEQQIFESAKTQVQSEGADKAHFLVVAGLGWHEGVIGIVASRLQEIWYRPTIVICIDADGNAKGSCRSVPGVNIFEALQPAKDMFTGFGGHEQAAGFSLPAKKIPLLKEKLERYGESHNVRQYHNKTVYYDLDLSVKAANLSLAEELSCCEPTGIGNPAFVFKVTADHPENIRRMGSEQQHLSFSVDGLRCVGFGLGDRADDLAIGNAELLCKLRKNSFRDQITVQGMITELHCDPLADHYTALKLVQTIAAGTAQELAALNLKQYAFERLMPDRKQLIKVYQAFKVEKVTTVSFDALRAASPMMNSFQLIFSLYVFKECELIDFRLKRGQIVAKKFKNIEKKDVNKTQLVLKLREAFHADYIAE